MKIKENHRKKQKSVQNPDNLFSDKDILENPRHDTKILENPRKKDNLVNHLSENRWRAARWPVTPQFSVDQRT